MLSCNQAHSRRCQAQAGHTHVLVQAHMLPQHQPLTLARVCLDRVLLLAVLQRPAGALCTGKLAAKWV